jgi:hypothetical protein
MLLICLSSIYRRFYHRMTMNSPFSFATSEVLWMSKFAGNVDCITMMRKKTHGYLLLRTSHVQS